MDACTGCGKLIYQRWDTVRHEGSPYHKRCIPKPSAPQQVVEDVPRGVERSPHKGKQRWLKMVRREYPKWYREHFG